jgi:hypothetical protein
VMMTPARCAGKISLIRTPQDSLVLRDRGASKR